MKNIAIWIVKLYQRIPGPWHNYCRFKPSCSDYMIGCLKEHGFIKGIYLGIKRILRCNPKNKGGYDPIPLKEKRNDRNK